MIKELGGLFGWLTVFAFVGTILNYIVKAVNRHYSKKISESPNGKKIMKYMMTLFVRNHRSFGFATIIFLIAHIIIQFSRYGSNGTGFIAAVLLIIQVVLGIYANVRKKPRKGVWFIAHRAIAILLIFGVALHLFAPYALSSFADSNNTNQTPDTVNVSNLETFTLEDLSQYDGKNGNKAYVAYNGLVYNVTDVPQWSSGEHNGQLAGTDLTQSISRSPHGSSVFKGLEIVGKLDE